MTAPATVPVTVTAEAAEHVAALGLQEPLEQMLAWLRENTPELQRLEVTLQPAYEPYEEPSIILLAYTPIAVELAIDPVHRRWLDWVCETFPPDVRGPVSLYFC